MFPSCGFRARVAKICLRYSAVAEKTGGDNAAPAYRLLLASYLRLFLPRTSHLCILHAFFAAAMQLFTSKKKKRHTHSGTPRPYDEPLMYSPTAELKDPGYTHSPELDAPARSHLWVSFSTEPLKETSTFRFSKPRVPALKTPRSCSCGSVSAPLRAPFPNCADVWQGSWPSASATCSTAKTTPCFPYR